MLEKATLLEKVTKLEAKEKEHQEEMQRREEDKTAALQARVAKLEATQKARERGGHMSANRRRSSYGSSCGGTSSYRGTSS